MIRTPFVQNLAEIRKSCNLRQRDMSVLLNMNERTYQSYEEGRAEPSIKRFLEICDLFDITDPDRFFSKPDYLELLENSMLVGGKTSRTKDQLLRIVSEFNIRTKRLVRQVGVGEKVVAKEGEYDHKSEGIHTTGG